MQDCSNSIANALELLQSCTKPSMWFVKKLKLQLLQSGPLYTKWMDVLLLDLMKSQSHEIRV